MSEIATLLTVIDVQMNDEIEQLEDEIDLEAYHSRKDEDTFTLDEILDGLAKK